MQPGAFQHQQRKLNYSPVTNQKQTKFSQKKAMGPAGIDLEALGKQGKRERAHSKNEKYEKGDGLI